nr:7-deoxyloganetic acid glucosyltransferase [Quercus suber]
MEQHKVPHVVILPLPLSGHVKPMLILAELLCDAGFLITFVNSDYNHDRLERVMDIPAFYNRSPGFRFVSISDGLPLDQPRLGPIIFQLFFNTRTVSKPLFRELLISLRQSTERSPPTCIIADGLDNCELAVAIYD